MAEDYQYITTSGTIVPDTSTILSDIQNEFQSVFGSDLIIDPSTPQGVLMTAMALARAEVVKNNAALANQLNPNLAGGVYLDSDAALTGLIRPSAVPSLVQGVVLAGVPFTVIPAGVQAQTSDGNVFESLATVTLPNSGTITVDFQSIIAGEIPCDVSELTEIVTPVLGWETVTNPNAAIIGTAIPSDASFRVLRNNTLAFQGSALIFAIYSRVSAVSGVQSMSIIENYTKADATIDGIFLLANSIYACVNGGDSTAIATALLSSKSLGSNWNGGQEVDIVDPSSEQTYPVKFDRPAEVPITIRVTIKAPTSITDPTDAVINAILDYVNGNLEGEPGFVVGGNVSCFELAGAINIEQPTIYVQNVETNTGSGYSNAEIVIAKNEIATTSSGLINVVLI